ncbi:MAG: D-alanyl-D-alanine carboxypeptidase [Lachnospiraceae bacterium]|nr:D-alanyl-D-alanine carboxypeptidase [Lachnospiraceae bacterium]
MEIKRTISIILAFLLFLSLPIQVSAAKSGRAETPEELEANAEERKLLPIQTNEVPGWPAGPEIGAEAAILMDSATGTILYAKNIDEELFPASTTKLMTCLIAMERGDLNDIVEFSYEAVHSVPSDGSTIGMDAGEALDLEEALYGIMVGSANEVANAVAEHIAGSIDAFVELMNDRAAELGCEHTHFVNTNGYHDDDHYTSARDLALIAREFFSNEMLSRIANTPRYHFEPTATQPDDFYLKNKHALINGEIEYEGICGGKTGFTGDARQTLVTCCEQKGMKLICVVLMEETPDQFLDTETLFNYGYSNFSSINVADNETRFTPHESSFFKMGTDIFGNSRPFLSLDPDSRIVVPNNVEFNLLDTEVVYDVEDAVARVVYSYGGIELGSALVRTVQNTGHKFEFEHVSPEEIEESGSGISIEQNDRTIFLNVRIIVLIVTLATITLALIIVFINVSREYHFSRKKQGKNRKRKRRGRRGDMYV